MKTNTIENLEFLRAVPAFKGLTDNSLQSLAGNAPRLDYDAGDVIVQEGAIGDTLYVIVSGSAEVVADSPGCHELRLSLLTILDVFGEEGIFGASHRSASVLARDDLTVVFAIHQSAFHRLFKIAPQEYAVAIRNLGRLVASNLRKSRQTARISARRVQSMRSHATSDEAAQSRKFETAA